MYFAITTYLLSALTSLLFLKGLFTHIDTFFICYKHNLKFIYSDLISDLIVMVLMYALMFVLLTVCMFNLHMDIRFASSIFFGETVTGTVVIFVVKNIFKKKNS